jgi:UDP:flavonoid glycosyltransferase YjiC (YdhE family)
VLSPLSLLSAIDPPAFAAAPWLDAVRRLGVAPYRAVFGLVKQVAGRWEAPLVRLRAELGLPPASAPALFEGQYSPRLNLALFSAVLAQPQADWPPNTVLCGFPRFDDGMPDAATAARLHDFLASGAPPVVFTLGSSVAHVADDFFEKAAAAARRLGCRALLVTGADPSAHAAITDAKQVLALRYLPYPAVFPHAAVNVHQAGIGTLAQALAAGRPQLILPVAFDQPDNARRAMRCGVGRTLPWKQVSVDRLAEALAAILSDNGHRRRAVEVARTVHEERAADLAAERIVALARR